MPSRSPIVPLVEEAEAPRSPSVDRFAADLSAHLGVVGPLPRMAAIAWLEAQGLGFHEAIAAVNQGLAVGTLAREGGQISGAPASTRKKNRILVVDDEPAIRSQLTDLLREAGYEIVEAADGYQAMERLREPPLPSLVLLDLILPGPSGWDVLAWMRRLPELATLPVRILTGMGDEVRVDGAKVLAKPLDLDELMRAVTMHCSV